MWTRSRREGALLVGSTYVLTVVLERRASVLPVFVSAWSCPEPGRVWFRQDGRHGSSTETETSSVPKRARVAGTSPAPKRTRVRMGKAGLVPATARPDTPHRPVLPERPEAAAQLVPAAAPAEADLRAKVQTTKPPARAQESEGTTGSDDPGSTVTIRPAPAVRATKRRRHPVSARENFGRLDGRLLCRSGGR